MEIFTKKREDNSVQKWKSCPNLWYLCPTPNINSHQRPSCKINFPIHRPQRLPLTNPLLRILHYPISRSEYLYTSLCYTLLDASACELFPKWHFHQKCQESHEIPQDGILTDAIFVQLNFSLLDTRSTLGSLNARNADVVTSLANRGVSSRGPVSIPSPVRNENCFSFSVVVALTTGVKVRRWGNIHSNTRQLAT